MDVRGMDVRSARDGSGALNVTFISTRSNGNERIIVRVVELALVSVMRNLRKELSFDAVTYFEDDCVCPKKKNL
jgi:hypothetical protein